MHKGNPYPRHPEFWTTRSWFHPGELPFQMYLSVEDHLEGPWAALLYGSHVVSTPGQPNEDYGMMTYEFHADHWEPGIFLIVSFDQEDGAPTPRPQLILNLVDTFSELDISAYAHIPYPQRSCYYEPIETYWVPEPPESPVLVRLFLRPAEWGEGRDPYPGS